MRIIAGKVGGRRLISPKGLEVRPTSDRLKESLFNILAPRLPGSSFLDLFAGTGALGLEAWSRGASQVVCVEKHPLALSSLQRNRTACGANSGFQTMGVPVSTALTQLAASRQVFDLIVLDPPYDTSLYDLTLQAIGTLGLLAPGGWLVAEHRRVLHLGEVYGELRQFRRHLVGDSGLTFYEKSN